MTLNAPLLPIAQSYASESGTIELTFQSDLPHISDDNALYSLAGACFGIYTDYQCTDKKGELVTDEDGIARSAQLTPGRYFIRQELASPGFVMSTRLIQVDVGIDSIAQAAFNAAPGFCSPEVLLREVHGETGNTCGIAGAKLGQGRYVISYYNNANNDVFTSGPTRSWTFASDDNGEVRLD